MVARRFPWVRMVVAGELCSFGPRPDDAQCLPGDAEARYCALAREHGLWLLPGSLYERDGDKGAKGEKGDRDARRRR